MNLGVKFELFFEYLKTPKWQQLLLSGILTTIQIAVFGLIIGIIVGMLIAVIKVSPKYKLIMRILDKVCDCYIAIFRGTPMVVQLLISYYVILPLLGLTSIEPINVGICVFGLNSGAYVAEIMRGGINSVDKGQLEAGRAVGLSYTTAMLKIVIPQAIKNIVPMLGNEFIILIKETSVVSFITVYDLYTVLYNIATNSYDFMVPFIFMALIYIVMVLLITLLIKLVEKIFAKNERKTVIKKTK